MVGLLMSERVLMSSLCEGSFVNFITRSWSVPHISRIASSTTGVKEVVITNGKRLVASRRFSRVEGSKSGWLKASPSMA